MWESFDPQEASVRHPLSVVLDSFSIFFLNLMQNLEKGKNATFIKKLSKDPKLSLSTVAIFPHFLPKRLSQNSKTTSKKLSKKIPLSYLNEAKGIPRISAQMESLPLALPIMNRLWFKWLEADVQ